jgi:uncharacterized OsmC-like protein
VKRRYDLNVVNHVDLEKVQNSIAAMKDDPGKAKKVNRVEGEWICEGSHSPQFKADFQLETGKFTLEADSPSFLGGSGTRPGPLHYCIFGLTSCFASTFMTLAAIEGIVIESAHFVGECSVDFSKTFGLSERPIIENAKFKISVKSNADPATLERLTKLAEDRCPGMFSLTNKIEVKTELRKE